MIQSTFSDPAKPCRRTLLPIPAPVLVAALLLGLLLLPAVPGLPGTGAALAQEPAPAEPAAPEGEAAVEVYRSDAADATGDGAGEPSPDDLEVFVDTLDVQVVNVDVYVTDKKGNRVTGLTRDDFELFEDGRPVTITNFYAVEDGRQVADAAAGEPAAEEPSAEPPVPVPPHLAEREALPPEQRLFLVVYVDNFNIRPANRNRVVGELGYFLARELEAGDQVMLVTYDRSLHVRRPFTTDPDLVARALDEVERLTGHAVTRDGERREAMDRIRDARSAAQALAYARMHAESVQNDLQFSLGALKELVAQLGGLPGRKALLYVSDGVPMVPGQDLFHAVQARFGAGVGITDAFHYDASRQWDQLAALANANRVTFYTIDAAGLRLASSFSVENANPSLGIGVDSAYNSNHQTPLRYIAEETGGQVIMNTNSVLPRLATVAEDFDTYYSLGYTPPRAGTGRYHDIRVKVKDGRGLVVRHRQGYRDKTIQARMNDGTLSALHFGFRDNPLQARVDFGEARQKDRRHWTVPVHVEIPIGELVLVPHERTHEARVRLYIAARDEEGDTSAVQQVAVPISIPHEDLERARGQHYRYSVTLLMRDGGQQVAVGVRDEIASKESFVVEHLYVGPRPDARRRSR